MQPYRSSRASAGTFYRCEPLEQRVLLSAAQLVRDVNFAPIDNSTASRDTAVLGSRVFFSAFGQGTGAELFVADTATGQSHLVKDFTAGSSQPHAMTAYGDGVYFWVWSNRGSSQEQRQLWRSDGTDAGTTLVKSFPANMESGADSRLVPFNGYLYFGEVDGIGGAIPPAGLWRTDGTPDGTVKVKTLAVPANDIQHLTVAGGTLYFSTVDQSSGADSSTLLWRSDGTTDGTVPVTTRQLNLQVTNVPAGYDDAPLAVTDDGVMYFVASNGTHGHELWRSDGSDTGTSMVADLQAGSADGAEGAVAVVGNEIYFAGRDATHGFELWQSDGTGTGTKMVEDLNPTTDSFPKGLTALGGKVYFTAVTSGTSRRPWVTDGTPDGTEQLADAAPPLANGLLAGFTEVGGRILFVAADSAHGREVWATDGTPAGTSVLTDLNPGPADSAADRLFASNGVGYFTATDGQTVLGFYRTDGTANSTALVSPLEVQTDAALTISKLAPSQFASIPDGAGGQIVLFAPTTAVAGKELWRSDGTAAGTALVKDTNPGTASSSPTLLTTAGGLAYFAATTPTSGSELWRSDGTDAGTVGVGDINPGPSGSNPIPIGALGNLLLFRAFDPTHGSEVWVTDGTAGGATLVKDINPGTSSSTPGNPQVPGVVVNGAELFVANRGFGSELWRSDGTAAGTFFLANGSGPITLSNGLAYFRSSNGSAEQLWKTDGTVAGTAWVADVGPVITGAVIDQLTDVNGTVFFSFQTSAEGRELWKSNGTAGGTVRVKDINPGAPSSSPANLVNLNGKLYFSATDGSSGTELWTSDGTTTGTVLVKDINPGAAGSLNGTFGAWLTNVNGTLYFSAVDPTSYSLWRSDGTAAGTQRVPDLYGGQMSTPTDLLNVGGTLFFGASSPATSIELFELTPDPAGLTATPGSLYSFAGLGNNKVLTVTSGTVTLTADLSALYPGASVSLDASNGATVVFTAEQHLENVSLSGGASIVDDSAGQPPAGGSGGSPGSVATPPPTPTPASGPLALNASAGGYVRDGAYAGTGFANDPSLVVKKGPAGYNREAYLTFDLSRVKSVRSARLRLYGAASTAGAGVPVRLFAARGALPKGKLTWKNRPGAAGAPLASVTVTGTAGRWYEWDLTAFLKGQKAAGHDLVTIALQAAAATDAAALFQQGRDGNRARPQLVIT